MDWLHVRQDDKAENTSIAASATEKLFVSRYIKCYSFFVSGSKDRRGRRSKNARKNMLVRNEGKEKQKKKNLPQKCRTLTLLRQLVITWHQSALQDNQHPFIITVKGIKNVHTHTGTDFYTHNKKAFRPKCFSHGNCSLSIHTVTKVCSSTVH